MRTSLQKLFCLYQILQSSQRDSLSWLADSIHIACLNKCFSIRHSILQKHRSRIRAFLSFCLVYFSVRKRLNKQEEHLLPGSNRRRLPQLFQEQFLEQQANSFVPIKYGENVSDLSYWCFCEIKPGDNRFVPNRIFVLHVFVSAVFFPHKENWRKQIKIITSEIF